MQKLLSIAFAIIFAVACQNKPIDKSMSSSSHSHNKVAHPDHLHHGKVVQGTQSDLEENVGDRVFFTFDSSNINTESQSTLTRQAAWLKANPNVSVTIEGHCDKRGTREYNLGLGERRANSVKNFLVSAGIDANRISIISYGKERPSVIGDSEEIYSQNRRSVTIVVN